MRAALLLLAACNVAIGILIAFQPARIVDFTQVVAWSAAWLRGGDPYAASSLADYPPGALVVFAPLALLPAATALAAWVGVNVVLSGAVAWMSTRLGARAASASLAAVVLLLPSFRTLNQFSLAAFASALAGFLIAPRHGALGGIAIGLSLVKPQIGGPVLLWALVSRRWAAVGHAVATQLVLLGVFAMHAGESPIAIAARYLPALARAQNRVDLQSGETSLQPLVQAIPLEPLTLQVAMALVLCGVLAWVWRAGAADRDLRFFAAASLVSLLAFRHLSYNLLLAVPAIVLAVADPRRGVRAAGVVIVLVLIASPPTLWRTVLAPAGGWPWLEPVFAHAYRAAVLGLFAAVVIAPGTRLARLPASRRGAP